MYIMLLVTVIVIPLAVLGTGGWIYWRRR